MTLKNSDLEFLKELENKLSDMENLKMEVKKLHALNERLTEGREKSRKRTRESITEKRKTNKNYARKKTA